MILNSKTSIKELILNGNKYYPDRLKFCIDRKRRVVSIDEELHIDMENELYDDGSNAEDIFGGDIVVDSLDEARFHLVWEAHPNIERNRLLGIGQGRPLTDQPTIDELFDILNGWVY